MNPADPPLIWRVADQTLTMEQTPLIMGIVNTTPDSFSDGGRFFDPQVAIDHALKLAEDGADIIDIGGESTRPYSSPVEQDEELRRVSEVISAVCKATTIPVSIDTYKPQVAAQAIELGARIINDVTGLEDPEMLELAKRTHVGICAMHMQGTPQTMQDDPRYADVVADILRYLTERRDSLLRAGIASERICLDPGIGFGKTHEHNLELLRGCHVFQQLGRPILIGHSRKGFIGKVLGDKECDRTAATVGVSLAMATKGMHVLRVHDVRETRHALQLFDASGGLDERH